MAKRTKINPDTKKSKPKSTNKPEDNKQTGAVPKKAIAKRSPATSSRGETAANNSTKKGGAAPKAPARAKKLPGEKLHSVTPSGLKDQTFFELVFEVTRQIPKGRVTSYGAIAASLGAGSSSRLVGWAMNLAGSVKPKIPAHRVVNRNGMLSGKHHFATPTQMQELLEKEGVKVKNDKVVDFKKLFWDPMDLG